MGWNQKENHIFICRSPSPHLTGFVCSLGIFQSTSDFSMSQQFLGNLQQFWPRGWFKVQTADGATEILDRPATDTTFANGICFFSTLPAWMIRFHLYRIITWSRKEADVREFAWMKKICHRIQTKSVHSLSKQRKKSNT